MFVNIEEIKKHLNIDTEFIEDDEYLMSLEEVAENAIENHIDCHFTDIVSRKGFLPPVLKQCILLMVGNLYANRESVAYTTAIEIPLSYQYLVEQYHNYRRKCY